MVKKSPLFHKIRKRFCPVRTIKSQFIETISAHQKITADEIISQTLDIFTKIGLNDGKNIFKCLSLYVIWWHEPTH